ncbi:MAG: PH domain-containing protein [Gemmatimonadales bacterium]
MNEAGLRFRSKIDLWLLALIAPAILIGPVVAVLPPRSGSIGVVLGMLALTVIIAGPALWIFNTTAYFVTESHLIVRCGPFRRVVPLSAINRIHPTSTMLSAPALSLDRLELDCGKHGAVVISPADKAGFVAAVLVRSPAVVVDIDAAGVSSGATGRITDSPAA